MATKRKAKAAAAAEGWRPASEGEAILRDVLIDPYDEAARLIYADWLEDNGREKDAAKVRANLNNTGGVIVSPGLREIFLTPATAAFTSNSDGLEGEAGAAYDLHDVDDEEAEEAARKAAAEELQGVPSRLMSDRYYCYRGGLIYSVTLPLKVFMDNTYKLFTEHPITRVRLSDRSCLNSSRPDLPRWATIARPIDEWKAGAVVHRHWLPPEIGLRLRGAFSAPGEQPYEVTNARYYKTAKEADDDLSHACVAHGRGLAHLPPLPTGG